VKRRLTDVGFDETDPAPEPRPFGEKRIVQLGR
jgi:hypothetical protein